MTTFIWPLLNSAAHSSAGTSFSRGFETDSKGHVARMKKPKKGPRTVTRKSPKRPPKPEAQATRLTPKPKGARASKSQPMLPFLVQERHGASIEARGHKSNVSAWGRVRISLPLTVIKSYNFGALMKTTTTSQPAWLSPNLTPLNVAVIIRSF